MSTTTVYLKNYHPYPFKLDTVDLTFDLHDNHVIVQNTMQFERIQAGELRLDGDELELIELTLDGEVLPREAYHFEKQTLIILACPDQFILSVVTKIYPQNNTKLSGLYRSNGLFCTQCEAEGFRRMTFFPDRPDVLAKYTTRIIADKVQYPVLLSNGNLVETGDLPEGRHWALWSDPFKKPSYLFALVAGQLAYLQDGFTTCHGRLIDLRIYVRPGQESQCQHAMDSLKKAMRWDEVVFGREYDLDIFMIVAVSDFNMGAMENKGLNIFNSKFILASADTATDEDYAGIESVVAHEYFHNWTGNRVTCRDWFQLSLKEGLTVFRDQEFSRDMNSRDVNRIADVKALYMRQFPEDASRMAHPVQPSSYQEINNFYTATIYEKGAEVIRMQRTLLGEEGFRRGMDLYFERHDGQAVTINDFVAAMQDANGVDFSQLKRWYTQAGTPEVTLQETYQDGCLTLHFTQTCPSTPETQEKEPFHIPIQIRLFDKQGQVIPIPDELLALRETEQSFHFEGLGSKPVVSVLREFSAPILLHRLGEHVHAELRDVLRYETDGFAKWDAAQRLTLSTIHTAYEHDHAVRLTKEDVELWTHLIKNESLDPALRAELLVPPSFEEVIQTMNLVDVTRLEDVRLAYAKVLGGALFDVITSLYIELWDNEDHAMHAKAYGARRLRNVCLRLMMQADEARAIEFCQAQFTQAKTMTDQLASFSALVNSQDRAIRTAAIQQFYTQWHANELVLDKWFSVQACAYHPQVLSDVTSLLAHESFNLKNPNKVRALIGAFSQANHRYFHAADGTGYAFLTGQLIQLDRLNPQVAARLAAPFTRWARLDLPRQTLIKAQLERLSALELSKDLRELVDLSMTST